MRKLLILFVFLFLASCGPHRMKCGPKRNCNSYTKTESTIKDS